MATKLLQPDLAQTLLTMLRDSFPGMEVETSHSVRWNRPCVTFLWHGFADLLPEERFYRLTRVIPAEFIETQLDGFVWIELAPGETLESFLAAPRSEDITDRAAAVHASLVRIGFFKALSALLGEKPCESCKGNFAATQAVFRRLKQPAEVFRDARLLFMHYAAYCDCQALASARVEPVRRHSGPRPRR